MEKQYIVVSNEEKAEEQVEAKDEVSPEMKQTAQEAERQAIILAEEQELAHVLRDAERREEHQTAYIIGGQTVIESAATTGLQGQAITESTTPSGLEGQAVIESAAAAGLEEDHLSLTATFSVVPEAVVKDKGSTTPTNIIQVVEHHPKAGKYFMIRTRAEPHYILTVEGGELRLLSKPTLGGGTFWHCSKRSGWLTFRNSVTGTFLSHNGQGSFSATQFHQEMREHFVTERHEGGGYILIMKNGDELSQVAISGDTDCLVEQKEEGTAWDFIEAKYVSSSVTLTYSSM
ncbi:hypothetical protein TrVFT333_002080 [Trichoderma virens FT-333]|nr:hypothetical protein TrVFT333_002080 [Trichoderma virens FT-333]